MGELYDYDEAFDAWRDETADKLEFATREYQVTTEHLIRALRNAGTKVPRRIERAVEALAVAIKDEWK